MTIKIIETICSAIFAKIAEWRYRWMLYQLRKAQGRMMRKIGWAIMPAMKEWIRLINELPPVPYDGEPPET